MFYHYLYCILLCSIVCICICTYVFMYLSLPSCILFSLVPVGIPSIDYFLHLNLFVFILSWIGVGWSVQVHFGGGFLKPSPLHGNCWVQQIPCPTSAMKVLKCLSMVSTQDHQGDLKASLAGGVCNTNNVFANRLYCIRLCHPNSRRWIMDDGGKIELKEERYRDGSNG